MPKVSRRFIFIVAGAILLGIVVAFHAALQHWVAIHTGTLNESGPYYGFWSGFGSDIAEITLLGGLIAAYRHRNCHVKGCARLGKPVAGTPYLACWKHHPDHVAKTRECDP